MPTTIQRADRSLPIRYGYLKYPVFSWANGDPSAPRGLAIELLSEIATASGRAIVPFECSWDDFLDRLESNEFDVVVDPILHCWNRPGIAVIPYCAVRCFRLLYHQDLADYVRGALQRLADAWSADGPSRYYDLQAALKGLAPPGQRVVVGRKLYEDDLRMMFGVPFDEIPVETDFSKGICQALKAKKVVLTDEPFALAAMRRLRKDYQYQYDWASLWDAAPLPVQRALGRRLAGFALRDVAPDVPDPFHSELSELNLAESFARLVAQRSETPANLGVDFISSKESHLRRAALRFQPSTPFFAGLLGAPAHITSVHTVEDAMIQETVELDPPNVIDTIHSTRPAVFATRVFSAIGAVWALVIAILQMLSVINLHAIDYTFALVAGITWTFVGRRAEKELARGQG